MEVGPRRAQEGPEHMARDEGPGARVRLSVTDGLRQRLATEEIDPEPTASKQLAVDVERPKCARPLQPRPVRRRLSVPLELHEPKPVRLIPDRKRSKVALLRPPRQITQNTCELDDGPDAGASHGRPVDQRGAKDRVVRVELRHEDAAGDRRPRSRWEPRDLTTFAKGGTFIAPSAAERSQTSSAKMGTTAPSISGCWPRTGSSGRKGASRSSARLWRTDVIAGSWRSLVRAGGACPGRRRPGDEPLR